MSDIESIKNVTFYQDLGTSSDFSQIANINNHPDQCIIRAISYAGAKTDIYGVYLVWCDIIQDFIGSFSVSTVATASTDVTFNITTSPQTTIQLKNPVNSVSQLRFVIYAVNAGNRQAVTLNGALTGDFSISMDFIAYKKR